MNITYNNLNSPSNLITFSDVPNILSIEDTDSGTYATLSMAFNNPIGGTWQGATSADTQWWISFYGETISNVIDPANAVNKNFYISSSMTDTAQSICRAFNNCPSITAKFNVYIDRTQPSYPNVVSFKAREIGEIKPFLTSTISYADGLSSYMSYHGINGTSSSALYNSKIDVDVYNADGYVTTLEKNYYGNECSFDMTPVLATLSEAGKTNSYDLYITSIGSSGNVTTLGSVTGNNTTVGYMVNQGEKYISATTGITIAQNIKRGKTKSSYNNTILYCTNEMFPLSVYTLKTGTISYTISYKDSAFQEISSSALTHSIISTNKLQILGVIVNIPSECFYVDVIVDGKTIRYNVIKPANASYGKQRIYWTNSYGGTSFFDFTGEKTINNESEIMTYNKNQLDYYNQDVKEKEKVYDTTIKTTYTVKTHLIEEDGKWTLYDLLQSPNAYTTINGETYSIIIEKVQLSEVNNQNIYEGTVTFHISQQVSL